MLSTAEMADRLGMSEEGMQLKRKRHDLLGLEFCQAQHPLPELASHRGPSAQFQNRGHLVQ
jgi:hypothetical protein